jgi:hypothetical protein
LLAKLTKNILRGVNFTNLKTLGGYITKSKPQGVCLQLSQTPGGDYAIWPKSLVCCYLSPIALKLTIGEDEIGLSIKPSMFIL